MSFVKCQEIILNEQHFSDRNQVKLGESVTFDKCNSCIS
jgi:hypothetical protein